MCSPSIPLCVFVHGQTCMFFHTPGAHAIMHVMCRHMTVSAQASAPVFLQMGPGRASSEAVMHSCVDRVHHECPLFGADLSSSPVLLQLKGQRSSGASSGELLCGWLCDQSASVRGSL